MTRFAIDSTTALRILDDERAVHPAHSLVGPAILRSQVLATLYRAVKSGEADEQHGLERLERLAALKIRLLGDRVSRATAWKIASRLGWDDTFAAENLAVAALQSDALITDDPALRAGATGIVPLAEYDDLFS